MLHPSWGGSPAGSKVREPGLTWHTQIRRKEMPGQRFPMLILPENSYAFRLEPYKPGD